MRALILSASAGSGKTYRLAYKYVHDTIKHFHTKPYLYRAILAVTFTNKATEEMKSRILKEIHDLAAHPSESSYMADLKRDTGLTQEQIVERASVVRQRILHDYSHFTILTIDKFFQRILRAFIKELGIDLNYNIELDTDSILARSIDSLIETIPSDDELREWMLEFTQERIDQNKSWDLRSNLQLFKGDFFQESNTLTIEQAPSKRELKAIISKAEREVLTVQEQARSLARRALQIIERAGVSMDDFAYKQKGFISTFTKVAAGEEPSLTKSVRDKAYSPQGWSKVAAAQAVATELQPLLAEIVELYDKNSTLISTLQIISENYRSFSLLQDIYRKVLEQCQEEGVMLLSQTKHILSHFIEGNDAPFIYEKTGNRFERFMIDEFQDTSLKEWTNFLPLLRNALAEAEDTSVLIVGDVKQSIYRWRGGDWRILQCGVSNELGKEHTHTVFMQDNYRSLRQVVEFNNEAIESVVAIDNAALNSMLDAGLQDNSLSPTMHTELYDTLRHAYTSHAQNAKKRDTKCGYVRVERFQKEEEPPIISYIESAIARGYDYKDIMILCRDKASGAAAAKTLLNYKQRNNSFNIMTQDSLIVGNSSVCNFIIATLRLSQDMGDTISLAIHNDYLLKPYDTALDTQTEAWLTSISQLSPEQAFEHIVLRFDLHSHGDQIAYLQALHEQVVAFCSSKIADIALFLRAWDESGKSKALSVEKSDSTIELLTIHKAKGLEKKIVIIPYCNWGLDPRVNTHIWATPDRQDAPLAEVGRFPINYKKMMTSAIFANDYYREKVFSHVEAINLLYVALTRAEEELYVCIPHSDTQRATRHIGNILWEAIGGEDSTTLFEYGEQTPPATRATKESLSRNILLDCYPTSAGVMNLRLGEQRYFEEGGERHLSARNIGIVMHSLLSQATTLDEVLQGIERLQKKGRISPTQAEELSATIAREFEREEVKEWFGEWDDVRTENDILCPEDGSTLRPDRVMIRGERAVVVDYKFGEEHSRQYSKQVERYMALLQKMGYTRTEGYLWYLNAGKIVKIEN